jgi:hypothetical protein
MEQVSLLERILLATSVNFTERTAELVNSRWPEGDRAR